MASLSRVSRLAGFLYFATIVVMIMFVGAAAFTLYGPHSVEAARHAYPNLLIQDDLSQSILYASAAVGCVSVFMWLWALEQMRQLFRCYRSGVVFTQRAAQLIQRIGAGLMGVAGLEALRIPVQTILLSSANPEGQRSVSVGLNTDMVILLLSAGLLIVIGWAMREASLVAEENKAFI